MSSGHTRRVVWVCCEHAITFSLKVNKANFIDTNQRRTISWVLLRRDIHQGKMQISGRGELKKGFKDNGNSQRPWQLVLPLAKNTLLSTKASILALWTLPARLSIVRRRAKDSLTAVGRARDSTSQRQWASEGDWPGMTRQPPHPEWEASEYMPSWIWHLLFQGRHPFQEWRNLQCRSSFLSSGVTRSCTEAKEEVREMAWKTELVYNLAAGTNKAKDVVFHQTSEDSWMKLSYAPEWTPLEQKTWHAYQVAIGKLAWPSCKHSPEGKGSSCNKEPLLSAMKYPKGIDMKPAIYAAISANWKAGKELERGQRGNLSWPTCRSSI